MRSMRQGFVAPSRGDNVSMQQLMETIRALQEAVAASRVDQDRFQVDLARSQANNEDLCKTNEELRRNLQNVGERTVDERAPPLLVKAPPMPFSQEIMDTVIPVAPVAFIKRSKTKRGVCSVEEGITRLEITREKRPEPTGEVLERKIGGKKFKLGRCLGQEAHDQIVVVIARHMDVFAWSAADMPGIDPDFLCHRLTMYPKVRPVRQRRRKFNDDRRQVIREETQKPLSTCHIREIQYPEWLANFVLVKKASGKWRMCVDFTDLNKACPKDSYPLPTIDALVDSASGCRFLSFLDAFSGYNQICMHPRDECKTTFMTELSCYCYKVMPFRLKNAGATYQRSMDRVLAPMIGRNVQAYVDDMVITSQVKDQHIVDLEELFTTIAKYRLKLNPEKCVFGVEAGKFLGFLLTEHGREANPKKCAAIIAMRSPISVKEVQQLTRQMAQEK